MNKVIEFESEHQVWRLLISNNDKLIVEVRNTDDKEVFFNCIDLKTGNEIFKNFQPEEKYWIGIETIHNDIIIFHKYAKPDMPGHSQIFAFDINKNEIIWQNEFFNFLAVADGKLYSTRGSMMGSFCYAHNIETGEIIEEIGADEEKIDQIQQTALESQDYSDYTYAEKYIPGVNSKIPDELVYSKISDYQIIGDVEAVEFKNHLFFNFHYKINDESIGNRFFTFNLTDNLEILNIVLNENLNAYAPDSFFIFKDWLIVLQDKRKVIVYKIE